ncbi:UNVERIFIED_CONTAM: hypothetical protein Sradi_4910600 [Sesamum radiatum]|uniref:CCHC-type domain-containing protein n=1 Tax=Sesamum radiatum TaxID=300843 RepID=A0AAW2MCF3_SESRA
MGKGKKRIGTQQQSRTNDICAYCREKGHWKRDCPNLSSDQGMFVVEVNMVTNSASWVLDTGCGAHICNYLQVLQRSRKLSKDEVVLKLGDDKGVTAEAVGIINLVVSDRVRLELKDCYFVPSMIKNIISIPLLDNVGFEFLINKNCFYLMKDGSSHLLGKLTNGLYILQRSDWIMTAQNKRKLKNLKNAQIWHARLGHIFQDRMKRLVDSKSLEIDNLDNLPTCESCLKGMMTKKPFVGQSYALEKAARLLNIAPSKTVAQTPYQIWHGKPASYKYFESGVALHTSKASGRQAGFEVFISRNAVFLERGFPTDTRRDELLVEESSEAPQSNAGTSSAPNVSTDNVSILRRSARVPQPLKRDRSKRILVMTQNLYVEKVLKRFKIEHSKRGFLLMRYGVMLSKKQSPKTNEELKRMLDIPMHQPWAAFNMLHSVLGLTLLTL